jgi:hypothetical protein
MELMGKRGVSSDESDPEGNPEAPCFRIISPAWRSAELAILLRDLDKHVLDRCQPLVGNRKKRAKPHRVRKLAHPELFNEKATAPPGLPRNCYDDAWYDQLAGWKRRELDAGPNHEFTGVGP